jgi:anti-sigma B factor antagonist
MNVIKKQSGKELFVIVEGNIDSTSAPALNDQICDSLNGIESLVFEFEKVNYISSAGLRVLLAARKALGNEGEVIIRKPNQNVLDVFEMSGFDNILKIEK